MGVVVVVKLLALHQQNDKHSQNSSRLRFVNIDDDIIEKFSHSMY